MLSRRILVFVVALALGAASGAAAAEPREEHITLRSLDAAPGAFAMERVRDGVLSGVDVASGTRVTLYDDLASSSPVHKEPRLLGAESGAGSLMLSWDKRDAARYVVKRDGVTIGETTALEFLDDTAPLGAHLYAVQPLDAGGSETAGAWVLRVDRDDTASGDVVARAGGYPVPIGHRGVMIEWTAFIRQARIDAPPRGCSYGTGFQFGGDNRGFGAHDQRYRIRINGSWDFTDRKVGQSVLVGSTKVCRKKDGKLVATRTASANGNQVRDAGGSNGDTAYLALRMVGTNPFCPSGGAIAGQMVIKVAAGGSWTVLRGSHRQMPAHDFFQERTAKLVSGAPETRSLRVVSPRRRMP